MNATSGHVVVTCQAMPLLRRSFTPVISGLLSSKIVFWQFKSAMNVRFIIANSAPCQHPYTPVVTIGPFDKWGIDFMTCNSRSTKVAISSSSLTILLNGIR